MTSAALPQPPAPGIEGQPTRVRLPGGKVVSGLVRDAQTVEIDL